MWKRPSLQHGRAFTRALALRGWLLAAALSLVSIRLADATARPASESWSRPDSARERLEASERGLSPDGSDPAPEQRPSSFGLTPDLARRGYNACYMPDSDFGAYSSWRRIGMGAQMIVPSQGGHTPDWGYDVVVHFHGHEAVRAPFVDAATGVVLVGIDLGISSAPYSREYAEAGVFLRLLSRITSGLQAASGQAEAHIRHLALSSWSAGFGAVTRILRRYGDMVDAVVLLDSLHSDYEHDPSGRLLAHHVAPEPIAPVLSWLERALDGDKVLYLSHSQIVPPGYASTREVADLLLSSVAGARSAASGTNALGARLVSTFDRGGMHVRGYAGEDKIAHCGHVALLAEAVRDFLRPAWGTPRSAP